MGLGDAISTAVSGLRANGVRVSVAANNIVNVTTPGFVADRVLTSSVATGRPPSAGGVVAVVQPTLPAVAVSVDQTNNVDLASEFGRLIQAKAAYGQSLSLIRTTEQMLHRQLDVTI